MYLGIFMNPRTWREVRLTWKNLLRISLSTRSLLITTILYPWVIYRQTVYLLSLDVSAPKCVWDDQLYRDYTVRKPTTAPRRICPPLMLLSGKWWLICFRQLGFGWNWSIPDAGLNSESANSGNFNKWKRKRVPIPETNQYFVIYLWKKTILDYYSGLDNLT